MNFEMVEYFMKALRLEKKLRFSKVDLEDITLNKWSRDAEIERKLV